MRWWAWLAWFAIVVAGGVGGGWMIASSGISGAATAFASVGVALMVTTPAAAALMLVVMPTAPAQQWRSPAPVIVVLAGLVLLGAGVAAVALAPFSTAAALGVVLLCLLAAAAALGVGVIERRVRRSQPEPSDRRVWMPMATGGAVGTVATVLGLAIWGEGLRVQDAPFALAGGALLALLLGLPAQLRSLGRVTASLGDDPNRRSLPRLVLRGQQVEDAHLASAREWARRQLEHQPLIVAQTSLLALALLGLNVQSTSPFALVGTLAMPALLLATIVVVARQRRRLAGFLDAHPEPRP